jgi:hypothetical protein
MQNQLSKPLRRIWITVNILSILVIVFFFYLGKIQEKPFVFFLGAGFTVVATIFSFIKVFIKTGLWKMVHSGNANLDEREMLVVLKALKYSYSAFVIFILLLIYGFALLNREPINIILAGCLLYIAHILPAVIIGWTEKAV